MFREHEASLAALEQSDPRRKHFNLELLGRHGTHPLLEPYLCYDGEITLDQDRLAVASIAQGLLGAGVHWRSGSLSRR